ncbi:MAG: prepilin-type N-terminal cleavage/methylation domain-containing protein [Kiritimatiellia bacterium]|jgi:type II secretory pathway component PulJ
MKRARRQAFTLVELLLASTIAGLAMVGAAVAIAAAFRSFASVSTTGDEGTRRVLMVAALQQDVASAMPLGGTPFAGEGDAMSFARLVSPSRAEGDAVVALVRWERDASGVVVRTLTRPGSTVPMSIERFVPAAVFRLAYAGAREPASAQETLEWADVWTAETMPGLVRATLDDLVVESAVMQANFALPRLEERP